MDSTKTAELLDRLGEAMVERAGLETNHTHLFLYNEVAPGHMSCSMYWVSNNLLTYVITTRKIDDLVDDLWQQNEYGERWRGIAMEVIGDRFTVSFDYPDGPYPPEDYSLDIIDEDDEEAGVTEMQTQHDRMNAAVKARFGDRPIVYPTNEEVSRQMMLDNATHSLDFDLEPPSSG